MEKPTLQEAMRMLEELNQTEGFEEFLRCLYWFLQNGVAITMQPETKKWMLIPSGCTGVNLTSRK